MLLVLQLEVADDQVYSHLEELKAHFSFAGDSKESKRSYCTCKRNTSF